MRTATGFALAVLTALVVAAPAAAATGHADGYIPAVAHTAGRFGSFWTSDVWIYQQGATVVHLWFNRMDEDSSAEQSVVVDLDQPVVELSDIVATVFGTEGVGSVHYLADGPVSVVSRTWTADPEGGSYGQTVPGVPLELASYAGGGQGGTLRMLVDQQAGTRANLGLVNVSPVAIRVLVEIFGADGQPVAGDSSFTVDLPAFGMTQVGDVLARLPAGQRHGLIIRAGVTSAEGGVMAYLSEVDNTTNDASYQEAFRFAF